MTSRQTALSALALLSAGLASTSVQAEVLQIEGLYPARVEGLESTTTIELDKFGGSDGTALAFAIEDKLSGVTVAGAPYFTVLATRSAIVPDTVLTGTATADISEFRVMDYREKCVERNDKGKCIKRKSVKMSCLKRVIDFQAQIRASRYADGRTIYAETKERGDEQTVCRKNEAFTSSEKIIRGMIDNIAYAVRLDLAPIERRQSVRVLESRKGMDKAEGKFFKAAVKMTKTDQTEACRMWDSAAANSPAHVSVTFNRGLCAERTGALDEAMALYAEAQQSGTRKAEIRRAIQRVRDRQQARLDQDVRNRLLAAESDIRSASVN